MQDEYSAVVVIAVILYELSRVDGRPSTLTNEEILSSHGGSWRVPVEVCKSRQTPSQSLL
jgi:hypothetical protein